MAVEKYVYLIYMFKKKKYNNIKTYIGTQIPIEIDLDFIAECMLILRRNLRYIPSL